MMCLLPVRKEHLVAASPRTRVQRRLLEAASSSPSVYEPHFLRNVSTPQKGSTPRKVCVFFLAEVYSFTSSHF